MKGKATMFLTTMLAIGLTAGQAMSATVCGVVDNAQGQPVSGCPVTVKDSSGKILGQTTTGSDGGYEISNLGQGTLDLFLDPCASGAQGGSGVLNMTGESEKVDWQVPGSSPAVTSQGGSCEGGGLLPAEWATIGVLGLAAGAGIAAIVWAETGNRSDHNGPMGAQF
jgi:Carboxypeptidase regulatory-like domain